jgi:hypothetical protein
VRPRKSIARHAGPAGPGALALCATAGLHGFFPPYTSRLGGGAHSDSQVMSGFAKAATVTRISPLNAKSWATADTTDQIIPTMMESLVRGANFTASVGNASTQLQNVLNTGSKSRARRVTETL